MCSLWFYTFIHRAIKVYVTASAVLQVSYSGFHLVTFTAIKVVVTTIMERCLAAIKGLKITYMMTLPNIEVIKVMYILCVCVCVSIHTVMCSWKQKWNSHSIFNYKVSRHVLCNYCMSIHTHVFIYCRYEPSDTAHQECLLVFKVMACFLTWEWNKNVKFLTFFYVLHRDES